MAASSSNRHSALNRMLIFLLIACAVVAAGFGSLVYSIVKKINPPPEYLLDADCLPTQFSHGETAPVDHVYMLRERSLRGSTWLRYHYVNAADFDARRKAIQTELEQIAQRQTSSGDFRQDRTLTEPSDPPAGTNAPWWDWREQADRDVCSLPHYTVFVFDKARKIVYVYVGE